MSDHELSSNIQTQKEIKYGTSTCLISLSTLADCELVPMQCQDNHMRLAIEMLVLQVGSPERKPYKRLIICLLRLLALGLGLLLFLTLGLGLLLLALGLLFLLALRLLRLLFLSARLLGCETESGRGSGGGGGSGETGARQGHCGVRLCAWALRWEVGSGRGEDGQGGNSGEEHREDGSGMHLENVWLVVIDYKVGFGSE